MRRSRLALSRRTLHIGAVTVALLLCAVTCALWVRSYWVRDVVLFRDAKAFGLMEHGTLYELRSSGGRLIWLVTRWSYNLVPNGQSPQQTPIPSVKWARSPEAGVAWHSMAINQDPFPLLFPKYPTKIHAGWFRRMHFAVPSLLLASYPLVTFVRRALIALRPTPGRCAACGYDLRATPDRCPECGVVPDASPWAAA